MLVSDCYRLDIKTLILHFDNIMHNMKQIQLNDIELFIIPSFQENILRSQLLSTIMGFQRI